MTFETDSKQLFPDSAIGLADEMRSDHAVDARHLANNPAMPSDLSEQAAGVNLR